MMLKVLMYAYVSGVFSSSKIAKNRREDVAFRVLHLVEFIELFVQVVRLARKMGLVKLGRAGWFRRHMDSVGIAGLTQPII